MCYAKTIHRMRILFEGYLVFTYQKNWSWVFTMGYESYKYKTTNVSHNHKNSHKITKNYKNYKNSQKITRIYKTFVVFFVILCEFLWLCETFVVLYPVVFIISRSLLMSKNKEKVSKMSDFPRAIVTPSIEPQNGELKKF